MGLPPYFICLAFLHQALEEIPFLFSHLCPLSTSSLHGRHSADFGDRHIPPAFIVGYAYIAIILNVDDRRTIGCLHCLERLHKISIRLALDDLCSQTACIRCQVNGQRLHIYACRICRPLAIVRIDIAGAEAILAKRTAESAYALEA